MGTRAPIVIVATAAALVACGGSSSPDPAPTADPTVVASRTGPPEHAPRAEATEKCSTRSEADFPGAYHDPDNVVVGPLVLVGAAYTDPATVREYGGNKFPLLVEAGHAVAIRIGGPARLAYGPLPQGEIRLADGYRSVAFIACEPGRASERYRHEGPSASDASGRNVTFWSGFVLTPAPACVPLDVFIDESIAPQRVGLALGKRC